MHVPVSRILKYIIIIFRLNTYHDLCDHCTFSLIKQNSLCKIIYKKDTMKMKYYNIIMIWALDY